MNRWYHPGFETDLISAARYYEQQRAGLGSDFVATAEAGVETIMVSPQRWPEQSGGIRRLKLDRFPFLIRYRITADSVQFLSILHGTRHPDTGGDRV